MSTEKANQGEGIQRLDQAAVSEYFGCNTFDARAMRERLSEEVFEAYREAMRKGERFSPEVAQAIAQAMKEWALERGCSHFTHWFQPMTGATAEKHDAFITWAEPGKVIEKFSGSQLVQGEPDASSFPSGGLRATFEARGYTVWDAASPAFLIEGPAGKTLCIPTAFVGYHGEALDHKVPMLRSTEVVNRRACEALALFGVQVERVTAQCGPEQEYFLVDQELARRRPDLLFANRTLQGARPPKGQELEDHYFGAIKDRVLAFMQEVELECFKLGIPAKTRHNEVAPNQFEIAPIYEAADVASDHNQVLMELMRRVAERHGLTALLHEKPFAGINGSGKHVNWSLATESGHNLLEAGRTPAENLQFLYFLLATLKAIHRHGGLLRATIASAGNDHRLGANEAPPAIMSAFLGAQLDRILDELEAGNGNSAEVAVHLDLGLSQLPLLRKDATDRNRTSPFAFTGNKFEFRAVGSSMPIARSLTLINAAVAEALGEMNAELASLLQSGKDLKSAVHAVVRKVIVETRAIRFEGNGYSEEWRQEAERRGLPHAKDTVEALEAWHEPATEHLYLDQEILTREELEARIHIRHEQYQKTLAIESLVLRDMAESQILPAVLLDLGQRAESLQRLGGLDLAVPASLKDALAAQTALAGEAQRRLDALRTTQEAAEAEPDLGRRTVAFGRGVKSALDSLREVLDRLELGCNAELWPLPKYRELLAPLQ